MQTSLFKIQIGAMFLFNNDLNLIKNKNTYEQHQEWWKMRNNRKMRILTRNDKITISNSMGVEKAHWKHYGHWVGHDFFLRNIVNMMIEDVGYNVEEHQELHRNIVNINILDGTSKFLCVYSFSPSLLTWCWRETTIRWPFSSSLELYICLGTVLV